MNAFRLQPSARLQRYLGQELISDPNLAVIEFVKNSYDAGASTVDIRFILKEAPTLLIIADDGIGMNAESFEIDWMSPGFSRKSPERSDDVNLERYNSVPAKRVMNRVALGEKGLGRFAAARLGEILEVYTRISEDSSWLHVTFNWNDFDDMKKRMDEILIPYDSEPPPDEYSQSTGTILVIHRLRLKWDSRVPGRRAPGRNPTRLGRLRQDLELLLRPLDNTINDFAVEIDSDLFFDTTYRGSITPKTASRSADYRYEFNLYTDGEERLIAERSLTRSTAISETLGEPGTEQFDPEPIGQQRARRDQRPHELHCGPFQGVFFYDPPPMAKRASQIVSHGVLVYRDGALVEPYGLDGNDWVGVKARKAQRQGHAPIQPNTFSGEIRITRACNPDLLDMANRQGLIENEATVQFFAHVQAEFRNFEEMIRPDLESRWKSKPDKAAETAEERIALARIQMRSIAHALRQPLLGLRLETDILKSLVAKSTLPDEVQMQIEEVVQSVQNYIHRSETLLGRLADLQVPEFSETQIEILISAAVSDVQLAAARGGIDLRVDCHSNRSVVLPFDLVRDCIAELILNAIESPRVTDTGIVRIVVMNFERHGVQITVEDDGAGFANVAPGTPLDQIGLETKGRPSGGLASVVESTRMIKGSVELVSNGPEGSKIIMTLPGTLT